MNFNHRKGKLNLYGDYSFSKRDSKQYFSFYRKVSNQGKAIETFSGTDRTPTVTDFNGRLGLDYQLNKKNDHRRPWSPAITTNLP
ncbi:MAG: hypothetical protein WDO71_16070 [Bacteroidota bacterium]